MMSQEPQSTQSVTKEGGERMSESHTVPSLDERDTDDTREPHTYQSEEDRRWQSEFLRLECAFNSKEL